MHALTLAAAFVLAVIATARLTRLVVHDPWPPIATLHSRWEVWQANRDYDYAHDEDRGGLRHGWGPLLTCPFCAAPYLTAIVLAVAMIADVWRPGWSLAGVWWTGAVWASVAYLAAIVVAYDEPED